MNVNARASFIWLQGDINTIHYYNEGFQGSAYVYLNFLLKNDFRASLNTGIYGPSVILQGYTNSYLYSSGSLSKELFHKKVTIACSVSNPFKQYRLSKTTILNNEFTQINNNYSSYRSFMFSAGYRFGKLRESVKRNKRGIINDDIKNGTNTSSTN